MERGLRVLVGMVGVLLVVGCAPLGQLESDLKGTIGRPASEVVDALGMPSSERTIADRHYLVWERSYSTSVAAPSATTTVGNFNTTRTAGTFSSTTLGTSYESANYSCKLVFQIGDDQRVAHVRYDGNLGGCSPYIDRLNAYREKAEAATLRPAD
ncbi:hypothetical protein UB44_23370 [Burkholderiaceae bacterium 26]|nr:hypothetical protein UB44_23370 [Burkholderiaceae bacterium 26]